MLQTFTESHPTVPSYEAPVLTVNRRFPALLRDVSDFVRLHPQAAKLTGQTSVPLCVDCGAWEVLLNHARPAGVTAALAGLAAERHVLQVFSDTADFLQFLTQADAGEILAHPQWQPLLLLPLEHATHAQQWFMRVAPSQWPWAIQAHAQSTEPTIATPVKLLLDQMTQMLRHRVALLAAALAAKYAGRPTPAQILRHKQRPLRVLSFASAGSVYQQFCARDMTDALLAEGAEARALIPAVGPLAIVELLQEIHDFEPDVLLLNGSGRARLDLPRELCVLSWDQDYVLSCSAEYPRALGPHDRLMIMVADWATDAAQNGLPANRLRHLNLGTNTGMYFPAAAARKHDAAARNDEIRTTNDESNSNDPMTKRPAEAFRHSDIRHSDIRHSSFTSEPSPANELTHDVLFVGNIHPFETYRALINFDRLDPTLQQIMLHARQRLDEWVLSRGQHEPFVLPDCDAFLRQTLVELELAHQGDERQWRWVVHYFRYRIAHFVLRQRYVEALCAGDEFNVGLFGNGWDKFPAVAKYARPNLPNGQPLRDAIHRSAINLHLHTWTVHHPRLYDTAAAGGFLLVGRVPEQYPLDTVFDVGGEVDSFGSIAELKQQVRRYLADPESRRAMAARAADRARREHDMRLRMRQAIEFLAEDPA